MLGPWGVLLFNGLPAGNAKTHVPAPNSTISARFCTVQGYVTGWDFHLKGGDVSTFKPETFPPLLKVDTWWDLTQSTGVKNFLDTSHGGVKNFLYTSGGEV